MPKMRNKKKQEWKRPQMKKPIEILHPVSLFPSGLIRRNGTGILWLGDWLVTSELLLTKLTDHWHFAAYLNWEWGWFGSVRQSQTWSRIATTSGCRCYWSRWGTRLDGKVPSRRNRTVRTTCANRSRSEDSIPVGEKVRTCCSLPPDARRPRSRIPERISVWRGVKQELGTRSKSIKMRSMQY